MRKKNNYVYIVFGFDDTNDAPVLLTTENKAMAKEFTKELGAVCYRYVLGKDNSTVTDETRMNWNVQQSV